MPEPQWSPCSVWALSFRTTRILSFRTTRTEPYEAGIEDGCAALARGAWADARACFAAALAVNESPEPYEGLGTAARYQLDSDAAIDAHERGYRLARSQDDTAAAALLAVQLAYDAYACRPATR